MGGELRQEAPATNGNGDSIKITGVTIGGPFIRKTVAALLTSGAVYGGYSMWQQHSADIQSITHRLDKLEGGQETIIGLLRHRR